MSLVQLLPFRKRRQAHKTKINDNSCYFLSILISTHAFTLFTFATQSYKMPEVFKLDADYGILHEISRFFVLKS